MCSVGRVYVIYEVAGFYSNREGKIKNDLKDNVFKVTLMIYRLRNVCKGSAVLVNNTLVLGIRNRSKNKKKD